MAGDSNVLCSVCRLPIIIDGNGNEDPEAGDKPTHRLCRARTGDTIAAHWEATALALKAGRLIRQAALSEVTSAWRDAVASLPSGPCYTPDQLRETVQRTIVSLLMKSQPRHAALLTELEKLFGKFPAPTRAAS